MFRITNQDFIVKQKKSDSCETLSFCWDEVASENLPRILSQFNVSRKSIIFDNNND